MSRRPKTREETSEAELALVLRIAKVLKLVQRHSAVAFGPREACQRALGMIGEAVKIEYRQ